MLLTIDVGNTHTVIGVWERRAAEGGAAQGAALVGEHASATVTSAAASVKCASANAANTTAQNFPWKKLCVWRLSTVKSCTADEIVVQLSTLISAQNFAEENIETAMMCSVVPRLTASWGDALRKMLGLEVQLCTADALGCAFACSYPHPHEIGMDYIADALAAKHIYGAPVVVFDFGTATNVSIIDASGTFKGGIIAPGVEAGAAALFSKATQLTSVALRAPEHVVGQSTDECIRVGIVLGEAARVDGLVGMITEELGYSCKVVATGGLSAAVGQYSKTITDVNPDLTLQGLCVAADVINKG